MTVSSTTNKIQYTGNGATVAFGFPYLMFAASDLLVTLYDTTANADVSPAPVLNGAATYDYTFAGTFDSNLGEYTAGGTITFTTAPPANYRVTIERVVPQTQSVTLIDNSKFPANTVNGALDRLTVLVQRVSQLVGQALRYPSSDPSSVSAVMPAAGERASMYLAFDSSGNPIASPAPTSSGTPMSAFWNTTVQIASAVLSRVALGTPGLTDNNTYTGTNTFNAALAFNAAAVISTRSALKVDSRTTVADAIYTVLSTDYLVAYTSLSAARTVTLPAASTFNAGRRLVIIDESGSASQTNAISLAPNGTDTIAGSNTTQVIINIPRGRIELECNGSNGWHVVGPWSVRYVSTLAADVTLNNTGTMFDVLSIAQGSVGTWRARASGTFLDTTTANASFAFKLTDGTTTFRHMTSQSPNNNGNSISFECEATSPAGNLKLQAQDASSVNGLMKANPSGTSATATQMIVERIS
jgi:hypothetical protein